MKKIIIYENIKKILLVVLGIILSLVVLEIGLQITSFTLSTIKKYRNKITKNQNTITILCLGESTTDGQWPPILQKILDKKSKHKQFIVIDEGVGGTNTQKIAEKTENNLIKYNPDIIISMMGINDSGLDYKKYKIKILSLFSLIISHIKQHFYYTEEDTLYLGCLLEELSSNNFVKIAYNIYSRTGYLDHNFCMILFRYIVETNYKSEKSMKIMNELIKKKNQFNPNDIFYIVEYLKFVKKYNTQQIKKFIIENKNKIEYQKVSTESLLKKYDLMYLLEGIKSNKVHFDDRANIKKSKKLNKENTKKNYNYIIQEIYRNNGNILVFPMQYPTLSVEKLKQDLKDSPYYDKLIFISNEENFKQALQTHKTEDIFRDMFAGTFGHCTEFGNTLIAENVAETILKLYN